MRFIVGLLLLFMISCSQEEPEDLYYTSGIEYYKKQQYDTALNYFFKAADHAPNYTKKGYTYLYIADIMRISGAYNEAVNYNLDAADLLTEDPRFMAAAFKNAGQVMGVMGNIEDAENYLYEAMKYYDSDAKKSEALNTLGISYWHVKNYQKAIETYKRSLSYHHREGYVLNNIGNTFLTLGNTDSAIHYFEKALPIKEKRKYTTYNNLAKAYLHIDAEKSLLYAQLAIDDETNDQLKESIEVMMGIAELKNDEDMLNKYRSDYISLLEEKVVDKEYVSQQARFYQVQTELLKREEQLKRQQELLLGSIMVFLITALAVLLYLRYKKVVKFKKKWQYY